MHNPELLMAEAYDEGVVSEVIRPAAIIPEESARAVLVELAIRDVQNNGHWQSEPTLWSRYDRPWEAYGARGSSELIGTIQVAYGSPTRYDITIYRATVTKFGTDGRQALRRGPRIRQSQPGELPAGVAERTAQAVPLRRHRLNRQGAATTTVSSAFCVSSRARPSLQL